MKLLLSVILVLVMLAGCAPVPAPTVPPALSDPAAAAGNCTLTFITVGKGDAFLLTTPAGEHYLVDTGKAQDYPQIARVLRLKGVAILDGIFLTHGHKDHAGSLEPLIQAFPTRQIFRSGIDWVSYQKIDVNAIAKKYHTPIVDLFGGETLDLGGVTVDVWLPGTVDKENENNNSLILRVTHDEISFLLMGDAELEEEALLGISGFPLKADLLKLGHHGETDATSEAFLKQVFPRIALIAGNEEENPDSMNETIAGRLRRHQIAAYYSEGPSLDFISDGYELTPQEVQDTGLPQELSLKFTEVDRQNQLVTISNSGTESAYLEGCSLISQRGDEVFCFPPDITLAPGDSITVVCRDSNRSGDLIWNQDSVWKKKRDHALLYDRNMNLLDQNIGPED